MTNLDKTGGIAHFAYHCLHWVGPDGRQEPFPSGTSAHGLLVPASRAPLLSIEGR